MLSGPFPVGAMMYSKAIGQNCKTTKENTQTSFVFIK
jgi:hypothetical protein